MGKYHYIRLFEKFLRNEASEQEKKQLDELLLHDRDIHSFFESEIISAEPELDEVFSNHLYENIRSTILSHI